MTSTVKQDSEENDDDVKDLLESIIEKENSGEKIHMVSNDQHLTEHVDNKEIDNVDSRCGLFGWSPSWMQRLASKKTYVIVYGLLGLNQSALNAYFIGTISTIEKRFKLPSTSLGIISSASDIGSIACLLLTAYFGSVGHKTRWVANGSIIIAIFIYIRYIPHYIYGPGDEVANYASNITSSNINLCNVTNTNLENCSLNSEGLVTFLILFGAQLAIGVGSSAYYTLGIAYLDDNSLKNKFPFLLALIAFIRHFGPTVGYLLSSYTLSIFIIPDQQPPFGQDDPRWIGSWQLGWLIFGTIELVLATFMLFFPKLLPREAERRKVSSYQDKSKVRSMKDFKDTVLRLIKNPILMLNTFSWTFYIFGMMGYWIFMPKYIETQFRKSASAANLITGSVGIACSAIGILMSGIIISKFKPRPTYLAAWNIFTETVDVLGNFAFAFLGCIKDDLHGSFSFDGSWNLTDVCNIDCDCDTMIKYSPVCSSDKSTTFYSSCHAGCTTYSEINGTKQIFKNCSCIPEFGEAMEGPCPVDCEFNFMIFITLLCLMKFLSSTGRAGNTIIQFRAVLPDDKSIAIAVAEVVFCIFALIPAPIFYGWLLDSSCLVWGVTCGKTGNCWLYDGQILRYLLNFTASGCLLIAVLLDVGVLWKVGKLNIYDEDKSIVLEENDKMNANNKTKKPFFSKNIFSNVFFE